MILKTIFILLVACTAFPSYAQKNRDHQGYKFSKEEMHELLLYQSKQQKIKGIVALITGPVITIVGLHIINKNHYVSSNGSSTTTGYGDGATIGYLISSAGILTTISSRVFFASSAKLKKRAMLVLANEPTGFMKHNGNVQGIGIQISL